MTLNSTVLETVKAKGDERSCPAAAAAVGQSQLMGMYETLFAKYNLTCAQVLITEEDIAQQDTLAQICDTTMELMQLGTIPIINDNDAVTSRATPVYNEETSEVLWDNDVLASRLARNMRADLLVMLTDMESLYAQPTGGEGKPFRLGVYREGVEIARQNLVSDDSLLLSDHGRGQFSNATRLSEMAVKDLVEASTSAVAGGVRAAVVTTGHSPLALQRIVRGEDVGTLFIDRDQVRSSKL